MRKIPAHALPLFVGLQCSFHRIGVLITELNVLVHVGAYRLNQRPSFLVIAKFRPSKLDTLLVQPLGNTSRATIARFHKRLYLRG